MQPLFREPILYTIPIGCYKQIFSQLDCSDYGAPLPLTAASSLVIFYVVPCSPLVDWKEGSRTGQGGEIGKRDYG